jgi:hypothetical protein
MKRFLLVFSLFGTTALMAQMNVFLSLTPRVEGQQVSMLSVVNGIDGKAIMIDHFDYYLSNIVLIHDGGQELVLPQEVYLIEPDNFVVYLGYLNVVSIEEIRFGVGVPSNLNTIAGADAIDISAYPEGHALSFQDPAMHWGWSAGYMHMIIGGEVDSNDDGTPNTYFELHNLGNNNYTNVSMPIVATQAYPDQLDIHIDCNVDVWLTGVNLSSAGILHGTSGVNSFVLKNVEVEPVFTQPATANNQNISDLPGKVWFHNTSEVMKVSWEGVKNLNRIELIDVSGREVFQANATSLAGAVDVSSLSAGTYQILLRDAQGIVLKKINAVR